MSEPVSTASAFDRYEAVRPRLPAARFPPGSLQVPDLSGVADRYDAFILDAFGVLNVGDSAIPGAVERMADLRRAGKRLIVLTNAASYPRAAALAKYHAFGFDFAADEVVSSRDVAASRLDLIAPGALWGAAAAPGDDFADIPARIARLQDDPTLFDHADAILLLSSTGWTGANQMRLVAALGDRPRPVVTANPDLVAPREGGLSVEPGSFAHAIEDATGIAVRHFGKPFPHAFADALARLPGIARDRIAMVGDTLHTDVLGGAAAGIGTVLIADHGLFAGHDVASFIARSGVRPDVIARTT